LLFDPKVVYDPFADRYLVVALEHTDNPQVSRILIAATNDGDPGDAGNPAGTWFLEAINSFEVIGGANSWADFPGLAVDEEAIYITGNMFNFGLPRVYGGSRVWIVNKTTVYDGVPQNLAANRYDPYALTGLDATSGTLQPAQIYGTVAQAAAVGTFLVNTQRAGAGANESLTIITITQPLNNPGFVQRQIEVGNVDDTGAPFLNAPQSGTNFRIATNDNSALNAVWRNGSLYTVNTVIPPVGDPNAGQATVHWYHVSTAGNYSLLRQGNVGAEDLGPGTFTFFGAVAVDEFDNIGIGFSASNGAIFPGAYYALIAAGTSEVPDTSGPLVNGVVRETGTLAAGLDYYIRSPASGSSRWGDYSTISLDPDGRRFWVYNQYAIARGSLNAAFPGDGRWGTRWGTFSSLDPFFRLYNPNNSLHVYTTATDERTDLIAAGYTDESFSPTVASIFRIQTTGTTNVWRLYNPNGAQHYYTLNTAERDSLVAAGWNFENTTGYMYPTIPQVTAVREVFHMYKPNAPGEGDRLYTLSTAERDALLASGAWQQHTSLGFGFENMLLDLL
jgi:hypothetical protein